MKGGVWSTTGECIRGRKRCVEVVDGDEERTMSVGEGYGRTGLDEGKRVWGFLLFDW